MIKKKIRQGLSFGVLFSATLFFYSCTNYSKSQNSETMSYPNAKSNEEWKDVLSPFQYKVLRESATERPFTGEYYNTIDTGSYYCSGCGDLLFLSDTKFDSGCGWPSFFEPVTEKSIVFKKDSSLGMNRTEVLCGGCGGHLGHVFDDGPPPTDLRFCINSASLRFKKGKPAAE